MRRARGQQRRRGLVRAQERRRRRRLLVVAVRHSCRTRLEAEVPPSCSCQTRLEAEAPPSSPALACVRASERQGVHRDPCVRACVRACEDKERRKIDGQHACMRARASACIFGCARTLARHLHLSCLLLTSFPADSRPHTQASWDATNGVYHELTTHEFAGQLKRKCSTAWSELIREK